MEIMGPRDVAALLGISPRRAHGLMARKVIPSTLLGKRLVTYRPVFDAWCARQIELTAASAKGELAHAS